MSINSDSINTIANRSAISAIKNSQLTDEQIVYVQEHVIKSAISGTLRMMTMIEKLGADKDNLKALKGTMEPSEAIGKKYNNIYKQTAQKVYDLALNSLDNQSLKNEIKNYMGKSRG